MKVRYNPVVGVVALVLGGLCLFLGLWVSMVTAELHPAAIAGVVPALIGILYLVRPYFWVLPGSVRVGALVGSVAKEYPHLRLEADGGRLYAVGPDGTRKRLPVARRLAHAADWRAVTGGR
jgi:hypothetical protein